MLVPPQSLAIVPLHVVLADSPAVAVLALVPLPVVIAVQSLASPDYDVAVAVNVPRAGDAVCALLGTCGGYVDVVLRYGNRVMLADAPAVAVLALVPLPVVAVQSTRSNHPVGTVRGCCRAHSATAGGGG